MTGILQLLQWMSMSFINVLVFIVFAVTIALCVGFVFDQITNITIRHEMK